MQRVLIVLEFGHHLLHLRAALERKWRKPRRHLMYIGPSSNTKFSLRRDDLMAIDTGKLQHKESIMLPIIWERDASRSISKGCTVASWKIQNFVHPGSNMIEMKKFVSKWTILRTKISLITWRNQNIFDTNRIGGSFSISLETMAFEKSFWLQRSVVYIKPFTPRIWRTTTQAYAIMEVSGAAPIIEFFLQLVAMEWLLVEFIIIQRKSKNGRCMQSDMIERGNPLCSVFG